MYQSPQLWSNMPPYQLVRRLLLTLLLETLPIAIQSCDKDSDDESNAEIDKDDSADESGDDVCWESDAIDNESDDDHPSELFPDFNNLNMSYDTDFLGHKQDFIDSTQIGPVNMEISSTQDQGSIECDVPIVPVEHIDVVEGHSPSVRLLSVGYEKEKGIGLENEVSMVNENKFLCSISQIRELFSCCMDVDCKMPLIETSERFVGCVLEIRRKCKAGHCGEWQSSKMVRNLYVNNLLTAASLLFSGNNFTKISLFSKCMSLAFFSPPTFHQYQRKYLIPLVNSWWKDMQERMFSVLVNQPVVLAGDGQMDSPGFSAKNCVYTLMHAKLDYVLHVELVDVWHSQLKSAVMEKVGCERALNFVMKKLSIEELVTDSSSQLIKMLGEYITHY